MADEKKFTEAIITIGGRILTVGESMTVRVAISNMSGFVKDEGLGDDEHGRYMTDAYSRNCEAIFKMIVDSINSQDAQ